MVDDKDKLDVFSRSIAVPKEAFLQSLDMNVSVPFAAMFRFLNMTKVRKSNISVSPSMTLQRHHTCITTCCNFVILFFFFFFLQDENSSTILGNEVIAVEMGTTIRNLTDKISVSFRNMKFVSKTTKNASSLVSLPTKRMFLNAVLLFCLQEGYPSCQSWNGEGIFSPLANCKWIDYFHYSDISAAKFWVTLGQIGLTLTRWNIDT